MQKDAAGNRQTDLSDELATILIKSSEKIDEVLEKKDDLSVDTED